MLGFSEVESWRSAVEGSCWLSQFGGVPNRLNARVPEVSACMNACVCLLHYVCM